MFLVQNVPQSDEESSSLFWNQDAGSFSPAKPSHILYFRAELITEVAGPPTPAGESKGMLSCCLLSEQSPL